ncbi:MAG: PEP-CTERM sorting domain-containing protein [Acidobacteriota bacterium]|nr:PEP-CTERM sorting domain-containing protein [Acidobacteriota bacterium]
MRKVQGLIVLAIILMVAGIVQAAPIDDGAALNAKLNELFVGGTHHVDTASPDAGGNAWEVSYNGMQTTLAFYSSGYAGATFGIYSGGVSQVIFSGTSPLRRAVVWTSGDGTASLIEYQDNGDIVTIQTGIAIDMTNFGFYVVLDNGTRLNSIGTDNMLAYQGDNDAGDHWAANNGLFATADYLLTWDMSGTGYYNEYIVSAESIAPASSTVPEPSSVLLLGGGLLGLGIAGYRKIRK